MTESRPGPAAPEPTEAGSAAPGGASHPAGDGASQAAGDGASNALGHGAPHAVADGVPQTVALGVARGVGRAVGYGAPLAVARVEFHVADIESSLAFYGALGFRVARRWEEMAWLDRDGAELVLHGDASLRDHEHYFSPHLDRSPRGVGVEVIVEVVDVDAVHSAAVAAGLRIVKPIQDRPWKARDFRVADPDGYFLRITSPLGRG